jgi:hypothetical protein
MQLFIGAKLQWFFLLKTSSGIKLNKLEGIDKSSNSFEIDKDYLWLKRPIYIHQIALNNDLEKLRPLKLLPIF